MGGEACRVSSPNPGNNNKEELTSKVSNVPKIGLLDFDDVRFQAKRDDVGLSTFSVSYAIPLPVVADIDLHNTYVYFSLQLSFDLVESWLASNPDALELKRNGGSVFRELALFQDYHGFPAFKNELVEFMAEMRGNRVKFDPNKLVLTAGSTSANETLMFCLAEPGEAFLLPTPYYPGLRILEIVKQHIEGLAVWAGLL
ncbi:hypothetical protein GBA52_001591 [Prunus armeniaca]|nr:hypothetical protein GBA52_001591 [Prunus armeniaca]